MAELRDVMRSFPQGVVVVTAAGEEGARGITVSSFISVSLTPPLVLISIMKQSRAHEAIDRGPFLVNVLAEDQGPVSDHFASPNKSSDEQFQPGTPGGDVDRSGPIVTIPGCLGYLSCRVVDRHEAADHTLFIGQVTDAQAGREAKPLVFYSRGYWGLSAIVHER